MVREVPIWLLPAWASGRAEEPIGLVGSSGQAVVACSSERQKSLLGRWEAEVRDTKHSVGVVEVVFPGVFSFSFRGGSVSFLFLFGWLGSGMDLAASSLVAHCFLPLFFFC
jgi:hypothetical protein